MNETENHISQHVVSVASLEDYDPSRVDKALAALLEPLGGLDRFIDPHRTVVLKPNLLKPARADEAVTTHPEIIRGVARMASAGQGVDLILCDSPAIASVARCCARLGLEGNETFRIEEAGQGRQCSCPNGQFRNVNISGLMLDSGSIINIAKAKTHAQMVMTLTTKNMFGAVTGLEKAQWHFRSGRDQNVFARLIVEVHQMVKPRLNILDAVVAMEGNGPGSGSPRKLGLLLASESSYALDAVFCRIIGMDPLKLPTIRIAIDMGLLDSVDKIDVTGPGIDDLPEVKKWKHARPVGLNLLPKPLTGMFDRLVSIVPKIDGRKCTMCRECVTVCAAGAMSISSRHKKAVFDRKKCISCFCCQEVCPEGAIHASSGILARLLGIGS